MKNDPLYTDRARKLRKNMTPQERHLWFDFLRGHTLKFYRQKVLDIYILDFYCPVCRLAVELDGGQHYEQKNMEYDKARDKYLKDKNIKVLRFSNSDIDRNFEGVCQAIELALTIPPSVG